MPNLVLNVRAVRVPPQVLDSIVRLVSVVVAGFHAIRARSHESLQDEAMDVAAQIRRPSLARRNDEVDAFVAILSREAWQVSPLVDQITRLPIGMSTFVARLDYPEI